MKNKPTEINKPKKMKYSILLGLLLASFSISAQVSSRDTIANDTTKISRKLLLSRTANVSLQNTQIDNTPNFIPPSPNAASLGRYGDIPVSLYTGIPSVVIPIFKVPVNGLDMNIDLSYHASGIQVSQESSNIGIGWSLNAGGVITRSIRGLPDEEADFGYFRNGTDFSILPQSEFARREIYNRINIGELDSEPDIYSFNFLGNSSKFLVKKVNESTLEGYAIDGSNMKIQWQLLPPSNNRFQWIITDTNGNRYYFGKGNDENSNEFSHEITLNKTVTYNRSSRIEGVRGSSNQRLFPSSWYLKQILLSNGEVVELNYINYTTKICSIVNESAIYSISNTALNGCGNDYSIISNQSTINGKKLNEIIFNNGKLKFQYSTNVREDLPESNDTALEKIILYDNLGNQIKGFELSHDYFNISNINNRFIIDCPIPAKGKLKLTSVKEFSSVGDYLPGFEFTYEGNSLPHSLSFAQDYWGYFNNKNNNGLVPQYLLNLESTQVLVLEGANRIPNEVESKKGILSKIVYPTGGTTEFEFEGNQALEKDFDFEINPTGECVENISLSRVELVNGNSIEKEFVVNSTISQKI